MTKTRKILLAGVAVLAMTIPVQAKVVWDPVQDRQGVMHLLNEAKELAHMVEQLAWMQRQYETLARSYNALSHITDLRSAAYALGGLTRNWYPEANAIPDLMSDMAGLWGRASGFNSSDLYYASRTLDKWGEEMDRRRGVSSNAKALASANSMAAENHLLKLDMLRARLESARDVTEVSAVNGLIALEQQNLDAHRSQSESVAILLAAEDRVDDQRAEQRQRRDAEMLMAATNPITGDLR